jgi:ribulose-5-phosphate 4-epimerase/fuculose-1-phosphate aldolase
MSPHEENLIRDRIAMHGESLYNRGYVPGSSGNISVRLDDGVLVTPTNSCLGRLDPARISKLDHDGNHLAGDKPSKEAFLHALMYQQREQDTAVVHLHSTHSVAVSCMDGLDHDNVLPPITAYYVMKVGKLRLLPYFRPGAPELARAVAEAAKHGHAFLLSNHGPVLSAGGLDKAVYAIEELEETARLFLMLRDCKTRFLNPEQLAELNTAFPN